MTSEHVTSKGISWTTLGIIIGAAVPLVIGVLRIGGVQNQIEGQQHDINRLQVQEQRTRDEEAKLGERSSALEAEVKLLLQNKVSK